MSELQKVYQAASKQAHKRQFEIAGEKLTLPRLTLGRQAQFEAAVRKDVPDFNLALTRNRAAMAMAAATETVMREIKAEGAPQRFKNKAEYEYWKQLLQLRIVSRFSSYTEALFKPFTRDHMIYAILLAMQQEYGRELKLDGGASVDIDQAFVEKVLESVTGNTLETIFLWVTGLVDIPEGATPEKMVDTLDEVVEQIVGTDPKAFEKPRGTRTTSKKTSPSSAPPMESLPMNSGSSTSTNTERS